MLGAAGGVQTIRTRAKPEKLVSVREVEASYRQIPQPATGRTQRCVRVAGLRRRRRRDLNRHMDSVIGKCSADKPRNRLVARTGVGETLSQKGAEGEEMHGRMMDAYQVTKQHREEVACEVEWNRLAKRLRAARKGRAGMCLQSILVWKFDRRLRRLQKAWRS